MARRSGGRATCSRGVKSLGAGQYRIRVTFSDPLSGRRVERDRIVEARSVVEAVGLRVDMERMLRGDAGGSMRSSTGGPRPPEVVRVEAEPQGPRLETIAAEWLRRKTGAKRPDGSSRLTPATIRRYAISVEDVIVPTLGKATVEAITRRDVERWRDHLGSQWAATTVNGYLYVLRTILADAGNQDAARVKSIEADDTRITDDEPNALDEQELARFLEVARREYPQHYALILVMFTTAMRIGTACALRREDFDSTNGVIHARRRLSDGKVVAGVKRSRTAKDVVPLHPEVWREVEVHWASHNAEQAASGLAFASAEGKHHNRSVLKVPFQRICKLAAITKRFTPHGCRRTAASLYRVAAGSVVAKSIAGHTTDRMHEHYAVVSTAEKRAAAERAFGTLTLLEAGSKGGDRSGDEVGTEERMPAEATSLIG